MHWMPQARKSCAGEINLINSMTLCARFLFGSQQLCWHEHLSHLYLIQHLLWYLCIVNPQLKPNNILYVTYILKKVSEHLTPLVMNTWMLLRSQGWQASQHILGWWTSPPSYPLTWSLSRCGAWWAFALNLGFKDICPTLLLALNLEVEYWELSLSTKYPTKYPPNNLIQSTGVMIYQPLLIAYLFAFMQ